MYRFSTSFNPPENQRMHDHRQEIQREEKKDWTFMEPNFSY